MREKLELDDVSFVVSKDHWSTDSWQYRDTIERVVNGPLADDVRKKVGASKYANVYITESRWADGYSTYTHWDESDVVIRCMDVEKTFKSEYGESVVSQIIDWINSD